MIFGAMYDANNSDEVSITVIATGLREEGGRTGASSYRSAGTRTVTQTGVNQPGHAKPATETRRQVVQPLPGLKTFKKPESTVEVQEIQIPRFFRKTDRRST